MMLQNGLLLLFVLLIHLFGNEISAAWDLQIPPEFVLDLNNTAADHPSTLWHSSIAKGPLPTNRFWQNFVLKDGSAPEYVHPYMVGFKQGIISICYPQKVIGSDYIIQGFVEDLSIQCKEESANPYAVKRYDDLSVTLQQGHRVEVPLVRGSPYITLVVNKGTPVLSTIHAVLDIWSNGNGTKHKIMLNSGQTWLVYSSSRIAIAKNLSTSEVFSGTIRIALFPEDLTCNCTSAAESALDSYSSVFPVAGKVNYHVPYQLSYTFMSKGHGQLLMLSLPLHRDNMAVPSGRHLPFVTYSSLDGKMVGFLGKSFILSVKHAPYTWYSSKGVKSTEEIADALQKEVSNLTQITLSSEVYPFGKALARAARLALIAEEIDRVEYTEYVKKFLVDNLTPWLNGSFSGNGIVYDKTWGGLISRSGAVNPGNDYGNGIYNDHHYHWGYLCYAGAVLAKLDPTWAQKYRPHLYALAGDYMSMKNSKFTRTRHFDPWLLHSWAGGLAEFYDGRNQESTSEAVNAYYSASLLGRAYHDNALFNLGSTLAAFESKGAQALWHISNKSTLYDETYVSDNRFVGVLWSSKRDSSLWFAKPTYLEVRLGIQIIPVSPFTEYLFDDFDFNAEAVNWTLSAFSKEGDGDGWRGFVYALQATYDPQGALNSSLQLHGFDDGNSLSNLLWWILSR